MGGVDMANMKYVMTEAVVAADGTVTTAETAISYGLIHQRFDRIRHRGLGYVHDHQRHEQSEES